MSRTSARRRALRAEAASTVLSVAAPTHRLALRLSTVLSVAATVGVLGAAPAFAHVTAQPGNVAQGSYSVVSLRVPNESDTAGTVKLEVTLPADHPLSSVRTTPVPGWAVIGAVAAFLASSDSSFMTASEVAVDGALAQL